MTWGKYGFKALALGLTSGVLAVLFSLAPSTANAVLTPLPTPPPITGAYGLEATKRQPPPQQGATIAVPGNGQNFTESLTTVRGVCPSGLLVQIVNNGVFAGAVMCNNGSYELQITLFPGANELVALVFDDLEQTGPESNHVTVTYTDSRLTAFGQGLTLTTQYGRRATPLGTELVWPLQLTGGTGPYAFSIDWGDGGKPQLQSAALPGNININHDYKKAGIYVINITVTDKNGVTAFLQVIAVVSGKVDPTLAAQGKKTTEQPQAGRPQILWVPTILLMILLLPTYWLGRRSMLLTIRRKMLEDRDAFVQKYK